MHLTEDFPITSRLIRKTFRDEQKMNPNSARNIWKLLARTRPDSNCASVARYRTNTLSCASFPKSVVSYNSKKNFHFAS